MKKIPFILVFALTATICHAQIINVPDAHFKQMLVSASGDMNNLHPFAQDANGNWITVDTNGDGEIQVSEALIPKGLSLSSYFNPNTIISDLTGIEYFTNLKSLVCDHNNLTSLNISSLVNLEWLNCSFNMLPTLNITALSNLTALDCSNNLLTTINLSSQPNLWRLYIARNQIPSFSLANNTSIKELNIMGNPFNSFDATAMTNLEILSCGNNQLSSLNLTGLMHLKSLTCSSTILLPSIEVNTLANLEYLDCSYNQFSALNVSGLTQLLKINCIGSHLTSLTLTGLTNLVELSTSYNQLTTIDVSDLVNLEQLECHYNQLTALDLTGLHSLKNLNCGHNQIASLTFENGLNCSGYTFDCSYNQLTALDTSGIYTDKILCQNNLLTSLNVGQNNNSLNCSNNLLTTLDLSNSGTYMLDLRHNNLISLYIKNGHVEYDLSMTFYSYYVSENPNLQYICADAPDLPIVQGWLNSIGYTNCHVNSYCSFTPGGEFYTVQGNNHYDSNNNGCDATDIVYPNLKFTITNGTATGDIIANILGNYSIAVQAGSHTITPVFENPSYFNSAPTAVTANFPTQASPVTQDFCITANGIHNDLEVIILPKQNSIAGYDSTYKIVYKNKGTQTQSGTVTMVFDDAVLDYVSATPVTSNQAVNYLSWNFTNLLPFETREITVTLNLNSPIETPPVNSGDVLNHTITISGATDETPDNNVFALNETVLNSLDPNDKTCLEGSKITPAMVGNYVHYMIRFENTGTANAQNVVVRDVIDTTKFNINTLIPLSGSHPFVTRILDTNKVEFIFENINLSFDDVANDGYVAFKIKTKPTLVAGDTFSNSANIYFDYNFPVVTNTFTTTVTALSVQDFDFGNYFSVYPVPSKQDLHIQTKGNIDMKSIEIYNIIGQMVLAITNAESVSTIDVSNLKSGTYFIKVNTNKGTANSPFIKE